MRIITWNCARAFRKKAHRILALEPNVVVVQECENPAECTDKTWLTDFSDWVWFGDNKNQGVGLFFRGEVEVAVGRPYHPEFKFIAAYDLEQPPGGCEPPGGSWRYTIVPIWANNALSGKFRYIGQVWNFLEKYKHELMGREVILLGDLNSNANWDTRSRWWNHSDVVRVLKEIGIESLYHTHREIEHGSEPENTFFLYKNREKGYHLDYIFGSGYFRRNLSNISVAPYDEWCKYSDHCPVICDFEPGRNQEGTQRFTEKQRFTERGKLVS
jgi:exonuclease III